MFLHQKYKHNAKHLETNDVEGFKEMLALFTEHKPKFSGYDTEANGLDIMNSKPFLIALGFLTDEGKINAWTFEPSEEALGYFKECVEQSTYLFAHNAKFDYHMMCNIGFDIGNLNVELSDSMTVMRLVKYVDEYKPSFSLEALGCRYVDGDSKAGGNVIKALISSLKREKKKRIKEELKGTDLGITKYLELKNGYIPFIKETYSDVVDKMEEKFPEPTYETVYGLKPDLMINYALDDVVIMLTLMHKAMPILDNLYGDDLQVFHRENKLINQVSEMERVGFNVDIDYMVERYYFLMDYKDKSYKRLWELLGEELSVGQHAKLKVLYADKFSFRLNKVDVDTLKKVIVHKQASDEAIEASKLIIKLRSIEKVISTYVVGKLRSINNGKIHTQVNTNGGVTGRVSGDMQQQPKKAQKDDEGVELFHPRRPFINKEDHKMFYFDYSQMELRVQADYTVKVDGVGDKNLCSAFVPFGHKHIINGEVFTAGKKEHYDDLTFSMWVDEKGDFWTPTDVHAETTKKAFPEVEVGTPEFKEKRTLGKIANFLKNYQGGVNALKDALECDDETANRLAKAYDLAFPKVKDYNYWLMRELKVYGRTTNMYGRKYVFEYDSFHYKCGNYMVQGSCADMMKKVQIKVWEYLKPYKSEILYAIHDELQINIHDSEHFLLPKILEIMEDIKELKYIPMVADIEVTDDNWANKREVSIDDSGRITS